LQFVRHGDASSKKQAQAYKNVKNIYKNVSPRYRH